MKMREGANISGVDGVVGSPRRVDMVVQEKKWRQICEGE